MSWKARSFCFLFFSSSSISTTFERRRRFFANLRPFFRLLLPPPSQNKKTFKASYSSPRGSTESPTMRPSPTSTSDTLAKNRKVPWSGLKNSTTTSRTKSAVANRKCTTSLGTTTLATLAFRSLGRANAELLLPLKKRRISWSIPCRRGSRRSTKR